MRYAYWRRSVGTEHDVLTVQICHRFTIYSLQLLFNEDACLTKFNTGGEMSIQSQVSPRSSPIRRGTGEGKVNSQTKNIIVTGFQSLLEHFCCPDIPGLVFFFRQRSVLHRSFWSSIPTFDRLIESISQCLVNLSDSMRSQIFCTGFYILEETALTESKSR